MRAKYETFPGFETVAIDLLFIADDATIRDIHDPANPDPLGEIRAKVRRRDIMLFVGKPRHELLNRRYSRNR